MQPFIKTTQFLLTIIVVVSCITTIDEGNDLIGKWYTLNAENGYTEFVIDTNEISVFSHYLGNRDIQPYTFNNDTLNFLHWDYSVGVKILSDTSMVLSISNMSDTLFALQKELLTFNRIHAQNDTLFATFYREFELRARNAWDIHGYDSSEYYDKPQIDLIEFNEEIPIKRK